MIQETQEILNKKDDDIDQKENKDDEDEPFLLQPHDALKHKNIFRKKVDELEAKNDNNNNNNDDDIKYDDDVKIGNELVVIDEYNQILDIANINKNGAKKKDDGTSITIVVDDGKSSNDTSNDTENKDDSNENPNNDDDNNDDNDDDNDDDGDDDGDDDDADDDDDDAAAQILVQKLNSDAPPESSKPSSPKKKIP
eukprot:CAMPEP_0114673740 /NCGR_PEP_ID=MMETSP0191-20121206/45178_1 /TAXON_ID=126664 /ORGANISM="Sorites sp." /LENGTH=195 /DNA_ID=CAMNT_0001939321 /DNA_START=4010 /DNA_END=4597 /DNA_ORIENTATION=-